MSLTYQQQQNNYADPQPLNFHDEYHNQHDTHTCGFQREDDADILAALILMESDYSAYPTYHED